MPHTLPMALPAWDAGPDAGSKLHHKATGCNDDQAPHGGFGGQSTRRTALCRDAESANRRRASKLHHQGRRAMSHEPTSLFV